MRRQFSPTFRRNFGPNERRAAAFDNYADALEWASSVRASGHGECCGITEILTHRDGRIETISHPLARQDEARAA